MFVTAGPSLAENLTILKQVCTTCLVSLDPLTSLPWQGVLLMTEESVVGFGAGALRQIVCTGPLRVLGCTGDRQQTSYIRYMENRRHIGCREM